jgi:thiosulfate/3-mercaptopyruvate sulfurtransferase
VSVICRYGNRALVLVATLGAVAAGCAPEGRSGPEAGMLVSPDSLSARLRTGGRAGVQVVVLHVARARSEYDSAHVPGARFLPLGALVTELDGLPNELPPVHVLDSVFTSVGVTDDAGVVLYGEPLAAARAWFTLDVLGHGDHAAVLDGGLQAWRAAGRPVTTSAYPSAVIEAGAFTPRHAPERLVDASWVAARSGRPDVALIDARPPEEYSGERPGEGVVRPGHIPGARSLFWKRALVSDSLPVLKAVDSLRGLFAAAGAEPGDTVITYCRTGVQASHVYFVARYLGFPVRMYDGSYLDWNRVASRPVER